MDPPSYKVLGLGHRKCQAHVGRNTLQRSVNTALERFWEAYLVNVFTMPRLCEVGHLGIKKKKANNQDPGLRINQLNTRMTANYTVKHKLKRSQKLHCYLKSAMCHERIVGPIPKRLTSS